MQPSQSSAAQGSTADIAGTAAAADIAGMAAAAGTAGAAGRIQTSGSQLELASTSQHAAALALFAGTLLSIQAQSALAYAFAALASMVPELTRSAELLRQLSAMSTTDIDEPEYEIRMAAYQQLSVEFWQGSTQLQALPLLHRVLLDLRNPDDLALRHASAQVILVQ
jgi:ABC-type cobalamin transport system ATPase subunit